MKHIKLFIIIFFLIIIFLLYKNNNKKENNVVLGNYDGLTLTDSERNNIEYEKNLILEYKRNLINKYNTLETEKENVVSSIISNVKNNFGITGELKRRYKEVCNTDKTVCIDNTKFDKIKNLEKNLKNMNVNNNQTTISDSIYIGNSNYLDESIINKLLSSEDNIDTSYTSIGLV